MICQTQQVDGKKQIVVRSPMEVVNNLQIPLELQLSNLIGAVDSEREHLVESDLNLRMIPKVEKL